MEIDIKDNGLIELIPAKQTKLVNMADRGVAQASVFLPRVELSSAWVEMADTDAEALQTQWLEESLGNEGTDE